MPDSCPKSRKQKVPKKLTAKIKPALAEIKNLRHTVGLLIPLAAFHRVVREIIQNINSELRITRGCLEALQESAELYMVQLLEDAYRCTLHRNRVTLHPSDIEFVRYIRGTSDVAYKGRAQ